MKYLKYLFILSIGLLLFQACDPKSAEQNNEFPEPERILTYNVERLELKSPGCELEDKPCAEISFSYPIFTDGPTAALLDTLNRFVIRSMQQKEEGEAALSPLEVMQQFIDDSMEFFDEVPDYFANHWTVERNMDVMYQNPELVTLSLSEYSYTGGAHGLSVVIYSVFDMQSGKPIKLEELFKPGWEESVRAVAEVYFRRVSALSPTDKLDEAGYWFDNNEYQLTDNFGISGSELLFYYNSYEIAPYAMGPTEVAIPLIDIREWLLERFLPDFSTEL